MMSLLTCVNKLKGNDYAVDYLQAYSGEKYFRERVDSLIDTYSDEEIVCADRPEA